MQRQPEPEYMDLADEADAYAEADFNDVNQVFAERLFELADDAPYSALDLGTGPADIPRRVTLGRPHWRIAALDAAFAMLRIAHARGWDHAFMLVQGDAKGLPFADHAFDVIFTNSILHHLSDPFLFWREIKRVAKPGALLFLRDLSRPETGEQAHAIVVKHSGNESELLQEEFYRSLLAAYTPNEIRVQLTQAGLHGLHVEQITDRHLDVYGYIA